MALPDSVHLSYSQMQTWRRCRRKWYFSYVENFVTAAPNYAFWLGTAAHEALDKYYASNPRTATVLLDAYEAWSRESMAQIDKDIVGLVNAEQIKLDLQTNYELGQHMMQSYADWAPTVDNFEVLATEQEFDLPLGIDVRIYDPETGKLERRPATYRGRIDGVVRMNDTGHICLLEHKTAKQYNERKLILDQQSTGYMWAAEEIMGLPIHGVLYNILRKQKPGPRVTAPLNYRLEVDRSRASVRDWPEQVGMIVRDMELTAEYGLYYHNPQDDCTYCPFHTVCSMIQDAADPEEYLNTYFQRADIERTADDATGNE